MNPKPATTATAPKAPDAFIFDAVTATFEEDVLKLSLEKPVLIEFWAPWCGPCKQLMPVLEQLVGARQGKVAMAKVNIDESPELAQAFRVQSVPMVVALYKGQPVTGFAGVRPHLFAAFPRTVHPPTFRRRGARRQHHLVAPHGGRRPDLGVPSVAW